MKTFFLLAILSCLPGSLMAERVALVIGNSKYTSVAELANPGNDSAAISGALTDQGFTVFRRDDLGQIEMRRALREFRTRADTAEIALIYYAGHGIEVAGENFLVPVDARLEDERDASVELVNVTVLLRQISGASSLKMIVLDACRNNPFVTKMRREKVGRNVGRGLGDIEVTEADTLIAYAAATGEITPDGIRGSNSPFTAAFLEALRGPPKDVRTLLGVVRDEMRKRVPGAAPFVYSSLGGNEFVINPKSAAPVKPASPQARQEMDQAATLELISDFVAAGAADDRNVWEAFLLKYDARRDHMLYAVAVRNLEKLVASAPTVPGARPASSIEQQADRTPEAAQVVEPPQEDSRLLAAASPPAQVSGQPQAESPRTIETAAATKDSILALQSLLAERKCDPGAVDGLFGRKTASAIARFAKATGTSLTLGRPPTQKQLDDAVSEITRTAGMNCPASAPAPTGQSAKSNRARPAPSKQCAGFNGVIICQ